MESSTQVPEVKDLHESLIGKRIMSFCGPCTITKIEPYYGKYPLQFNIVVHYTTSKGTNFSEAYLLKSLIINCLNFDEQYEEWKKENNVKD